MDDKNGLQISNDGEFLDTTHNSSIALAGSSKILVTGAEISMQEKLAPVQLTQSYLNSHIFNSNSGQTTLGTLADGQILDTTHNSSIALTGSSKILVTGAEISSSILAADNTIRLVGQSLSGVQNFVTNTGILAYPSSYDFSNNTRISLATSSVDTLSEIQKKFIGSTGEFITHATTSPKFASSMMSIAGLSALSIDAISTPSPVFSTIIKDIDSKKDINELKSKVLVLQEQISYIKNETEKEFVSKTNDKIKSWLNSLDPKLAKWFEASSDAFYNKKNKDPIGQSAESMTRVIEFLPDFLVDKSKLVSQKENDQKKESLELYLSQSKNYTSDYKQILVAKQKNFYQTLAVRHRKTPFYMECEKNPSLYEAVLLDIDCWLLALIASNE